MTGAEGITFLVSKTRENCNLGKFIRKRVDGNQVFGNYLHNASSPHMGKIATLVIIDSSEKINLSPIAKSLAMHITAMKPLYISKQKVPSDVTNVKSSNLLENQEFISPDNDENLTVGDYIANKGKELKTKISIKDFMIFSCA